jgi:two-component system, chemotaxis family, response regulator Rcp1
MNLRTPRSVEILLVEDNPGDVLLTQEALVESRLYPHVSVVEDGEEALRFLRRQHPHSEAPRPDLILLDLNLPKKDGRELLRDIKSDAELCQIPVIVLTTSAAENDVLSAYRLHANCYLTKPFDVADFFNKVRSAGDFWLKTVELPSLLNGR